MLSCCCCCCCLGGVGGIVRDWPPSCGWSRDPCFLAELICIKETVGTGGRGDLHTHVVAPVSLDCISAPIKAIWRLRFCVIRIQLLIHFVNSFVSGIGFNGDQVAAHCHQCHRMKLNWIKKGNVAFKPIQSSNWFNEWNRIHLLVALKRCNEFNLIELNWMKLGNVASDPIKSSNFIRLLITIVYN